MTDGNVSGLEDESQNNTVSAATQQIRKMDIDQMPSYYKNKNVIGDSFTRYCRYVINVIK